MDSQKNSMTENNNIENEYDFMKKIPKYNQFSVPKDYFEVLPEVINNKILDNKSLDYSFDKLSYRILAPISVLVLVFSVLYFINNDQQTTSLTSEEISTFLIEEHYDEIDEDLLVESYAELLAENEKTTTQEDQYIDYLIENDIELETLIESY